MLLSAFSLGYVPVQIPASLLARRVGEKVRPPVGQGREPLESGSRRQLRRERACPHQ
jgi:hypothetical protein